MRQYAASPIIQTRITNRRGYFDPSPWVEQFYGVVWNVDTAQGFGLDIWGRIVGVGRELQIPQTEYFGFNTTPATWGAFGEESLYSGPQATQTATLADPAYRTLILAKALGNIADTTPGSLNGVLQNLFPDRGRAWVQDLGSMSMRYVFEFALEPWERAVLVSSGVIPRPAGVLAIIAEIPTDTFGFAEAGDAESFNVGTLLPNGAVTNAN